ncbi:hypothetical protein Tco_0791932 [Tanacetum coccineum]
MSIRELQEQVAALAQAVKQYCSNRSCSCCGGPRNGGNYPRHNSSTVVSSVEVHIIVMIAKQGTCPSMIRVLVTIRTLVMTNLHSILHINNNSSSVVSDDYTEVTYDKEQCLSDHYTAPVTPPAYTPSIPFLATMEPADTFVMGDEVISTIPARETDEFIKSSVDDFVPIPRESEVTSDSNLECDVPVNTPLPTTDVREENFDINSPLGEQVVDFLIENIDVADLPRHMVKQLFGLLVKNLSSTKGMSNEPLGDDSKPRSYDVTFSNPLFDFNDDSTLCYDNPMRSLRTLVVWTPP